MDKTYIIESALGCDSAVGARYITWGQFKSEVEAKEAMAKLQAKYPKTKFDIRSY